MSADTLREKVAEWLLSHEASVQITDALVASWVFPIRSRVREVLREASRALLAETEPQAEGECICPYTDPKTWLSAASCGYGSGYEPGSMQEWDPDCPVHPGTPSPVAAAPDEKRYDGVRCELCGVVRTNAMEGRDGVVRCQDWLTCEQVVALVEGARSTHDDLIEAGWIPAAELAQDRARVAAQAKAEALREAEERVGEMLAAAEWSGHMVNGFLIARAAAVEIIRASLVADKGGE